MGQRYGSAVFMSTIRISFKNLTLAGHDSGQDGVRKFFPIWAKKLRFKEVDMPYKLDGFPGA